ncbi:hypothetical protein AAVH_41670 [Aphelenchoides avenae]|nr:hypothetical protein AAVH_41670 [Aphelenchus avenae]
MRQASQIAHAFLTVCFFKPKVVNGVQFAAIADNLDLSTTMITAQSASTAVDIQSCLDAAYQADPTIVAFSFDNSTGDCSYSTKIFGSFLREPGTQPSFFLRMDGIMQPSANSTCLTVQDAEYLIMEMSYSNQTCVQGSLDAATSLCIATEYSFPYGNYAAGNLRDGTQYLLTKDLAAESVNYQCTGKQDTKVRKGFIPIPSFEEE